MDTKKSILPKHVSRKIKDAGFFVNPSHLLLTYSHQRELAWPGVKTEERTKPKITLRTTPPSNTAAYSRNHPAKSRKIMKRLVHLISLAALAIPSSAHSPISSRFLDSVDRANDAVSDTAAVEHSRRRKLGWWGVALFFGECL